jgi:hypothetical protein
VPRKILIGDSRRIKIIAAEYEDLVSKIPAYSKQFLLHIHVEMEKILPWIESGSEYAALLPLQKMAINDEEFSEGGWIGFDRDEGTIGFAKGSNRN